MYCCDVGLDNEYFVIGYKDVLIFVFGFVFLGCGWNNERIFVW